LAEKYDPQQEEEARVWIEAVLGEQVFGGVQGPDDVQRVLKDGKVLVRYFKTQLKKHRMDLVGWKPGCQADVWSATHPGCGGVSFKI